MIKDKKNLVILMVDDDADYYQLTKEALAKSGSTAELFWVPDGEECLNYLYRRGDYVAPEKSPRPSVIFMDMNMPRKNGLETLREIKASPEFKLIPVAMLTISRAEEHVARSYDMGANSFITKPLQFDLLVQMIKTFSAYWHDVATVPTTAVVRQV